MNELARILAVGAACAGLCIAGCKEKSAPTGTHDGHDHTMGDHADEGSHDGHDHGGDDHADDEAHSLGAVTIGGARLEVSYLGELVPNAEAHIEVEHTAGPAPVAIRMWIGDEAGTGALRAKADAHDDHFHAHVATPATIGDATALWIEVETASGSREKSSIAFH